MDNLEVHEATLAELRSALDAGRTTTLALAQAYRARIEAYDQSGPSLNAIRFISPDFEADARALDAERGERGPRSALHGIPILIKDNYDVAGWPTHAGCRGLHGLVAERDATVIARLREAGALLFAKTNLHELAAGITSISSDHGETRNPFDPTRNPGGSSGGTSAAVAASFGAVGLGSDTCGSIRIPSAHCGLYGLRPTQGRTPMDGIVPLSLTQDVVGPLARSCEDLALVLDVMAPPVKGDFTSALGASELVGRRIGRVDALFGRSEVEAAVTERAEAALEEMSTLGAEIVPIEFGELEKLFDEAFLVILGDLPRDLAAYLEQHPSAPVATLDALFATNTIHPQVAPIVGGALSGPIRESPDYADAIGRRDELRKGLLGLFEAHNLDALAYPTIRQVPVPLGEDQPGSNAHASANSGLPAISIPIGSDPGGMPVGLELLGVEDADRELVAMAYAWERSADRRRPPHSAPPVGS